MLSEIIAIFIGLIIIALLILRFGGDKFRDKFGLMTSPQYLEREGRMDDAIHQYRTAGNFVAEAQLLEQMGSYEEAAKVYIRLQDWLKTSEMFELLRDWEMSALYAKKAGDIDRAIESFRKGNSPLRIAEMLLETGLHTKAADLFLEAGDTIRAVHALNLAGSTTKATELMAKEYLRLEQYERCGECLLELGRSQEATQAFEKGGYFERAAQIHVASNDIEKACRSYVKAGLFLEAANLLCEQKNFRGAARMFLKGGFSKKAFELLAEKNEWFEISKICLQLNKPDQAVHFMNKISSNDLNYAESRLHFANFYVSIQQIEKANDCLEEVLIELGYTEQSKAHACLLVNLFCRMELYNEAKAIATRLEENNLITEDESKDLHSLKAELAKRSTFTGEEENNEEILARLHFPKLERYKITSELGRGTQGIAYLAHDTLLDRQVVIKMLRDESLKNEDARRYFLREAKIAASINHPNVVTLYDLGELNGHPFTAMEYVDGITLEQYLSEYGKPLPYEKIIEIFSGVCMALDEAAQHGIVHRDVKPENIMMSVDGNVKLMDFGLARGWLDSPEQSALLVGTPFYMSPEQIIGDPLDHRTDIYSLGIILYRMITGNLPFTKGNILRMQRLEIPSDPRKYRKNLSPARSKLILSMLEKKPENRPDSSLIALRIFKDNDPGKDDSLEGMNINKDSDLLTKPAEPISFDPFSDITKERSDGMSPGEEKDSYHLDSNIGLVPLHNPEEKKTSIKDA